MFAPCCPGRGEEEPCSCHRVDGDPSATTPREEVAPDPHARDEGSFDGSMLYCVQDANAIGRLPTNVDEVIVLVEESVTRNSPKTSVASSSTRLVASTPGDDPRAHSRAQLSLSHW